VSGDGFGAWLRARPLRPSGTKVRLFNGRLKGNQRAHHAVVDIDLIGRNLQQCADAVIRLRAEWQWARGRHKDISFRLTNGMNVPWKKWSSGWRVKVEGGRRTRWVKGRKSRSKKAFRRYLKFIMTYAGTASLARQLKRTKPAKVRIGDILVQGGFPGHAVIVLDMAKGPSGKRFVMLGQSFMPAQDFHVLANRNRRKLSPWYRLDSLRTGLATPEWRPFKKRDLRTW